MHTDQFLHLPCVSLHGRAEYIEFRRQNADLLATRWLHERSLASTKSSVTIDGTCGVCLQPARFTASTGGGDVVERGRMPNWREGLACDCASGLLGRERAMLQFVLANTGLPLWTKVLILGDHGALPAAIDAYTSRVSVLDPRAGAAPAKSHRNLLARVGPHHLVLAPEIFHLSAELTDLLAEVARILLPGGHLVFTAPFHSDAEKSVLIQGPMGTKAHAIGWDILEVLREAGFGTASAHLFWSEEFGYLGSPNFLFSAPQRGS